MELIWFIAIFIALVWIAEKQKFIKKDNALGILVLIAILFLLLWRVDFGKGRHDIVPDGAKTVSDESCNDCDQY